MCVGVFLSYAHLGRCHDVYFNHHYYNYHGYRHNQNQNQSKSQLQPQSHNHNRKVNRHRKVTKSLRHVYSNALANIKTAICH